MKAEVSLEGLSFYAYHGLYDEERKSGNRFLVDIKVITSIDEKADFDDLGNTVDYEVLYKIVQSKMSVPVRLLEKVGKEILDEAFLSLQTIESAEVSITKYSPPLGGPCEKSKVTLKRIR